MKPTSWTLVEVSVEGERLLKEAAALLGSDKCFADLVPTLPTGMGDSGDPVRVVFGGQYASGKSSLLKMLTGIAEIKVGPGVVTDVAATYPWHGIELTDTPGICADRPEHDARSQDAIAKADLLAFVTTSGLMDNVVAESFRKLAIDGGKGEVALIVVNKMDQHADKNSLKAQEIVRRGLSEVIAPRTWENTPIAFVASDRALSAQKETDPVDRELDWADSGWDAFIATLNEFVASRGLLGRQSKPVFALEQVLLEAANKIPSGDRDADAVREMWMRERRQVVAAKGRAVAEAVREGRKLAASIRQMGVRAMEFLKPDCDVALANAKIVELGRQANAEVEKAHGELAKTFEKFANEFDSEIEAIETAPMARAVGQRVALVAAQLAAAEAGSSLLATHGPDAVGHVGKWLVKNAHNPANQGVKGLRAFTGGTLHEAVLNVGKFFGVRFKPYQALKFARLLKVVGSVLSFVAIVLPVAIQLYEDRQQKKADEAARQARAEVHDGFNTMASAVEDEFERAGIAFGEEFFSTAELDEMLGGLAAQLAQRSELQGRVEALLVATRALKARVLPPGQGTELAVIG